MALWTRKSGLYETRPTLRQLYQGSGATLFETLQLPDMGDTAANALLADEVVSSIMMLHGDQDTIATDWRSLHVYLQPWSLSHLAAWTAIKDALAAEYDPISNYNMTERETPASYTETETPAETTRTIRPAETTETETPAETTRTITPAATTDTERPAEVTDTGDRKDGIFGFDGGAVTPSPADTSEGKTVRTVQTAGTLVRTTQTPGSESMDVDTAGSRSLEVDTAGSEAVTVQTPGSRVFEPNAERVLTREGNIGVTTSQQMLESEVQLRMKYQLANIIVADFTRDIIVGVW
jgi:hypothetical protein